METTIVFCILSETTTPMRDLRSLRVDIGTPPLSFNLLILLISDFKLPFADNSFNLSDRAFNFADTHRVFELPGSVLEAEVKKFFFKGGDFIDLFVGVKVANLINLHAYHRLQE